MFLAEGKDFVVSFTSGKREQLYKYDGIKTSLVDFGVLSVRYTNKLNADNMPHYTLFIDTMQYEGVLEFNPIDSTYVADIEKTVSDNADLYVRIYGGGIDDQMKMPCISQHWAVSYKQAFDIATDTFAEKLKTQISKNKLLGEFFIKIVGQGVGEDMTICWYISYLGRDKTTLTCIIDTATAKVLATKAS